MSTLVLLSGGLDSTVLLAHYVVNQPGVEAISFNYGQRHLRLVRTRDTQALPLLREDPLQTRGHERVREPTQPLAASGDHRRVWHDHVHRPRSRQAHLLVVAGEGRPPHLRPAQRAPSLAAGRGLNATTPAPTHTGDGRCCAVLRVLGDVLRHLDVGLGLRC